MESDLDVNQCGVTLRRCELLVFYVTMGEEWRYFSIVFSIPVVDTGYITRLL